MRIPLEFRRCYCPDSVDTHHDISFSRRQVFWCWNFNLQQLPLSASERIDCRPEEMSIFHSAGGRQIHRLPSFYPLRLPTSKRTTGCRKLYILFEEQETRRFRRSVRFGPPPCLVLLPPEFPLCHPATLRQWCTGVHQLRKLRATTTQTKFGNVFEIDWKLIFDIEVIG